jgi:hypothetical protein
MSKEGDDDKGAGGGDSAAAAVAAKAATDKAAADAAAAAAKGGGDKGLLADHIANKGKGGEADKGGEDGRPADVPEQFWDKEKKAVNYTAWNKSHNDTRQALKAAQGNKGTKVDAAEGYKYDPPAGIPDHINTAPDDPTVLALRSIAFEAGLSQEQFATLTKGYFEHAARLLPAPDLAAEKAKLGDNAEAVMNAVEGFGRDLVQSGIWSPEEFDEIVGLGSTATGLRALNKLRESLGGQQIPLNPGDGEADGGWSLEECYEQAGTQAYYDNPSFRAKVDKRIEKLVGTAPAGSSPAGMGVKGRPAAAKAA